MKMEHRAIIERAKRHGALPSELAHELLVHDLVEAAMFELRNIKAPYSNLNEGCQQEVIDRITEKAKDAASVAVQIINARGAVHVQVDMKAIKVEAKTMTITAKVDGAEPNKHELTDAAGKLCLLVMAPQDYDEGLDFIRPDRDQPELPLHAGDIAGGLFDQDLRLPLERGVEPDSEPEPLHTPDEQAEQLYQDAVAVVLEDQKADAGWLQMRFAIGQEQAEALLDRMRTAGLISEPDEDGKYAVLQTLDQTPAIDPALSLE